jgi:hypothetical protein
LISEFEMSLASLFSCDVMVLTGGDGIGLLAIGACMHHEASLCLSYELQRDLAALAAKKRSGKQYGWK